MFKYLQILKFHLSYGYESHAHVFSILSVLKMMFRVSLEADLGQHLHGGEVEWTEHGSSWRLRNRLSHRYVFNHHGRSHLLQYFEIPTNV